MGDCVLDRPIEANEELLKLLQGMHLEARVPVQVAPPACAVFHRFYSTGAVHDVLAGLGGSGVRRCQAKRCT